MGLFDFVCRCVFEDVFTSIVVIGIVSFPPLLGLRTNNWEVTTESETVVFWSFKFEF